MSLSLYFHPLSSFCQKALTALYENDVPFTPELIDLSDPQSRGRLTALWPVGKFPLLHDVARDRVVPEASIIIEYLHQHYPGRTPLLPADADAAREVRMRDRFYDLYVNTPMQKIVTDRLRPEGQRDAFGVEQSRSQLRTALDMIEADMPSRTWACGDGFSMADCAAAPALFYADMVEPFRTSHPKTAAYLARLMARPSYARALEEAGPYLAKVPR